MRNILLVDIAYAIDELSENLTSILVFEASSSFNIVESFTVGSQFHHDVEDVTHRFTVDLDG